MKKLPSLISGSITRAPTIGSACHLPLVISGAPVGATIRSPAPAAQRAFKVFDDRGLYVGVAEALDESAGRIVGGDRVLFG